MAACEKCWRDAAFAVAERGGEHADHYQRLIKERVGFHACTPREQCGDMHLVLAWMDGTRHCRCGDVWESSESEEGG